MGTDRIQQTEICVIGGGPAGAVTALRLARLRHRVCLVERELFPRAHIGESLPPSILPPLELLGLRERVEAAGFLRPRRAIVRWADDAGFEKPAAPEAGFQVDRGRFDAILLKAATDAGVRVIQPGAARRPRKDAAGFWRIPVATGDGTRCVRARFLVDAVGKRSLLGGASTAESPPTIALFGYWRPHEIEGPETRVEAGRNHWYWGAPLPDGSLNATVFVDPKSCPAKSKSGLEDAYRALIDQSNLLGACLSGRLIAPVQACDATSRCAAEPIGTDWIKVGESAFSIDPLSSQGVQSAVRTAMQAAVVVHTMLVTPQNAAIAAEFYREQQRESVERNRLAAAQLYAQSTEFQCEPFWRQRASAAGDVLNSEPPPNGRLPALSSVVCLAPDVRLEPTPVIDGDRIVRRTALAGPALQRRVAYLHGIAVDDLRKALSQPRSLSELILEWSRLVPIPNAGEILQWLWHFQIITLAEDRFGSPVPRILEQTRTNAS